MGTIGEVWKKLINWRENSHYKPAQHQWLEESLTPPIVHENGRLDAKLDLYLPVAK